VGCHWNFGAVSPARAFSSGDENVARSPTLATPPAVSNKPKKNDTAVILLQKDKIMETANAQNSTFANRKSRRTTKICKRAVFFHRTKKKATVRHGLADFKFNFDPK